MPQIMSFAQLAQPALDHSPRTVVGLMLNDPAYLAELGPAASEPPYKAPPKAPVLYIKPANTYARSGSQVVLPADVSEVWVGACLGIQIGQRATAVKPESAADYIAGYRLVADLTVPHQTFYRPAIKQKCRDGFCPLGEVSSASAVAHPDELEISVTVDNAPPWRTTTHDRVRSVAQALADVTEFMTLHAGDVLLLGIPANPPLARAGQEVQIHAEGFTPLSFTLVAAEKEKSA